MKILHRICFRALLAAFVLCLVVQPRSFGAAAPDVDLDAGTVNGTPLRSATVDAITDALGRPSAMLKQSRAEHIVYADLGLHFEFRKDGQKLLTVFLERQMEPELRVEFSRFTGKLSNGINADTKAKDVARIFEGKVSDNGMTMVMTVRVAGDSMLVVDPKPAKFHGVIFLYDHNTKFLKQITISADGK